ncbi:glycosyltransferase [Thiomicrorhabdus sp. 6S3-12]|uniref:glycosyltransferase n=1 Tax=Thiomicrorhabdus sp. 6S3-12 TaxID=2819681 RepID=UPI001AACC0FE|nr:glycosyltransferase [Thiomicrorhabdus sp. 6S3-12]MBO1922990.1 glycosyltransferase [Thiomicrorhabdus sp. 6S3-12]
MNKMTPNQKKISVALATYNGAEFLSKQIQSLLEQTVLPDEIVISDDNSSDSTIGILNEYQSMYPNVIKVIKNRNNVGYAQNFNNALVNTVGDFVFLCDQDDVWFPNKIEYMVNLAESKPGYFVYMNDALLTDKDLNQFGFTSYEQLKKSGVDDKYFVLGCCCLLTREYLDFVLPIPMGLKSHDNWLVEISYGIGLRYIEKKPLQLYRRYGGNVSDCISNSTVSNTRVTFFLKAFKRILARNNNLSDESVLKSKKDFLKALLTVKSNLPENIEKRFESYLFEKEKELDLLQKRISLRKKFILFRFFFAGNILLNRKYGDYTFVRFLRDVWG